MSDGPRRPPDLCRNDTPVQVQKGDEGAASRCSLIALLAGTDMDCKNEERS